MGPSWLFEGERINVLVLRVRLGLGGSMEKEYIGDSVYAAVSDYAIILTTENGYPDDPRNVIYLEKDVFEALVAFAKRHEFIL